MSNQASCCMQCWNFAPKKTRDDRKCLVFIVTGFVLVKIDLSGWLSRANASGEKTQGKQQHNWGKCNNNAHKKPFELDEILAPVLHVTFYCLSLNSNGSHVMNCTALR